MPRVGITLPGWPTAEALARAELEDVLRAWSGLGRYARAHNRRLSDVARAFIDDSEPLPGLVT